ncbi:MAG TPA: hypothetical protein VK665_04895 [Candidatus Elarobacter sp.]|nr:hypothetical protein [Candidatus Elarobacter sp.]
MPLPVAGLVAMLYAVRPVVVPRGMSLALAQRSYQQLWEPRAYRRPTTFAMGRDGTVAAALAGGGSANAEGRILLARPTGRTRVLPPLPDALIAHHTRAYAPSADGRHRYIGGYIQNVCVTDGGAPVVTFAFPFGGAYAGFSEASFIWTGTVWADAVPAGIPAGRQNVWVAAASRSSIAFVADVLDESPNELSSADETSNDAHDQVIVLSMGSASVVGNGIATDIVGDRVAGYDDGFEVSAQGVRHAGSVTAVMWSSGRARRLGGGIAWALGRDDFAVGDDRHDVSVVGHPVCWRDGRAVLLSGHSGSAFATGDRDMVVGRIETGAFVATCGAPPRSFSMLDPLIDDHRWHIEGAYRISSGGAILALAVRRAEKTMKLVVLVPLRRGVAGRSR